MLKALAWEFFLISALVQGSSPPPEYWWSPEYSHLVKKAANAPKGTLTSSFRIGPKGEQWVNVTLRRELQGLILVMVLPKEAIRSLNPGTGQLAPSTEATQVTIRDQDLDGRPDDVRIDPSGELLYPEDKLTLTKDGFVRFRDSADHQAIKAFWTIGIGHSVNHFLHGVDSALPLEQGRKDEGVAEPETAASDSIDPAAERELAAFYLENKQYESAARHYRNLLSRDPRNAELHHALGIALTGQGKFAEAEAELAAAVNSNPNLKEAYFDLAFAAQRNKDYATTVRALDARARFYPENPGTYFMRATAYDSLKDFKQAAQNYRQFLLVANGKYPDEEWKARHRLRAIESK